MSTFKVFNLGNWTKKNCISIIIKQKDYLLIAATCMPIMRKRLWMTWFHIVKSWAAQFRMCLFESLLLIQNFSDPSSFCQKVCHGRGAIWWSCFISRDTLTRNNKYADCMANTKVGLKGINKVLRKDSLLIWLIEIPPTGALWYFT